MGIGKEIGDALGSAAGGAVSSGVGPIADLVRAAVVRIWPDPAQQSDALLKLRELEHSGQLQEMATEAGLIQAQIEVNKIEAASTSLFVAGWRPAAGWVGVSALFFATTVVFAVRTGVWLWRCIAQGEVLPPPELDVTDVVLILGQLLGLATLRSVDKRRGVA